MTHKLFTSNGKAMLFNLVGFEHPQYFEYVQKIEERGGIVSLPDEFKPEAMTIVNTDICYSVNYILDSVNNDSLVDAQNYCLKNILENINNIDDGLSTTTMADDEELIIDQKCEEDQDLEIKFTDDYCPRSSPDLYNVENYPNDEETEVESLDEEVDNSTDPRALTEELDKSYQLPVTNDDNLEVSDDTNSNLTINTPERMETTHQSDDNDDVVSNSEDEAPKKFVTFEKKRKLLNDISSSSESSEEVQTPKKKLKTMIVNSENNSESVNDNDKPKLSQHPPKKPNNSYPIKLFKMIKQSVPYSPPTSDDEEELSVKKIRPVKKKVVVNDVPEESVENIKSYIESTAKPQENVKSSTNHSSDTSIDEFDNPRTSSNANSIEDSHAKWLNNQKLIEPKMKKKGFLKNSTFDEWEDITMLWYLIKYRKYTEKVGDRVWKDFHADGFLPHRSVKGLGKRLTRLLLIIHRYKVPDDIIKNLKKNNQK